MSAMIVCFLFDRSAQPGTSARPTPTRTSIGQFHISLLRPFPSSFLLAGGDLGYPFVDRDSPQQEDSGQNAGRFSGEIGQAESVLQDDDNQEAEQGAVNGTSAAKDRTTAQDHGCDCRQFVTRSRI